MSEPYACLSTQLWKLRIDNYVRVVGITEISTANIIKISSSIFEQKLIK